MNRNDEIGIGDCFIPGASANESEVKAFIKMLWATETLAILEN